MSVTASKGGGRAINLWLCLVLFAASVILGELMNRAIGEATAVAVFGVRLGWGSILGSLLFMIAVRVFSRPAVR